MEKIKFDIKAVLENIKTLLHTEIANDTPAVMSAVMGYVADAEERLSNLATGALSGELDYKFVTERLKEETINVKNQLLSLSQILGANLETLADKAVLLFETALKDAINKKGDENN